MKKYFSCVIYYVPYIFERTKFCILLIISVKMFTESGGSVSKFPGSYQKRDFAYNAPSETTASKKYPQPREKIGFKGK